jgi:hypothetical protein
MSLNKYNPHVIVIPEDRADEQIANGFARHDQVRSRQIQIVNPAGGWRSVLKVFEKDYIRHLREHPHGHVIMVIDFDGHFDDRRPEFDRSIPDDLKRRVFVVGPMQTPQALRRELGLTFELIGNALAENCYLGTETVWLHAQLRHNEDDRRRLLEIVKPILFGP